MVRMVVVEQEKELKERELQSREILVFLNFSVIDS